MNHLRENIPVLRQQLNEDNDKITSVRSQVVSAEAKLEALRTRRSELSAGLEYGSRKEAEKEIKNLADKQAEIKNGLKAARQTTKGLLSASPSHRWQPCLPWTRKRRRQGARSWPPGRQRCDGLAADLGAGGGPCQRPGERGVEP